MVAFPQSIFFKKSSTLKVEKSTKKLFEKLLNITAKKFILLVKNREDGSGEGINETFGSIKEMSQVWR